MEISRCDYPEICNLELAYTPGNHNVHERQLSEAKPPPLIRPVLGRGAILDVGTLFVAAGCLTLLKTKVLGGIFLGTPETKGLGAAGRVGHFVEDAAAGGFVGSHVGGLDSFACFLCDARHCSVEMFSRSKKKEKIRLLNS